VVYSAGLGRRLCRSPRRIAGIGWVRGSDCVGDEGESAHVRWRDGDLLVGDAGAGGQIDAGVITEVVAQIREGDALELERHPAGQARVDDGGLVLVAFHRADDLPRRAGSSTREWERDEWIQSGRRLQRSRR